MCSPRAWAAFVEELADDWRRLDDRVDAVTGEVQAIAALQVLAAR